MGGVMLPAAHSPLVASKGKSPALLPTSMWDLMQVCPFPPQVSAALQSPWGTSVSPPNRLCPAHGRRDPAPAARDHKQDTCQSLEQHLGRCHSTCPASKHHVQWQLCHFSCCDRHAFNDLPRHLHMSAETE